MNAIAEVFYREATSVASPIKSAEEVRFAVMHRFFNKMVDAVYDQDLYESDEEPKPRPMTIIAAADALSTLSPEDVNTVEIEPYSGELGLVWKSGRTKRVKAMFGPGRDAYSVYYEHMLNGHVVEHHLQSDPDHGYLRQRLAWLHT
jgi:hypothetical protein